MAFADAMKVNEGTMTSSPGPTPAVASARCSPVVQDVVATPCFAPTYAATAFSNSATFGPWVTHPLLIDSYGACASSSPSDGFVIGTDIFLRASTATQYLFPPLDELRHTGLEARLRLEAEQFLGPPRITDPPRGERAFRLGLELHPDRAAGEPQEERREIAHLRLDPTADVHDSGGSGGLAREEVRPDDVADVDEIDRRRSVTEERERLALVDQVQPADHHLDEPRPDVHPRAVDVEVPQCGGL